MGAELFHDDGQIDGQTGGQTHDEDNSRFSRFCERA